jgi:hydrogenase maturation protease
MLGTRDSGFGIREVALHEDRGRDAVLVLCLGNDILRDDGVGWAIAHALEASLPESRIPNPESRVLVKRSALSGFYLLDELTGWNRVLVVDAVKTGQHPPGEVLSFPFEALGTEAGPSPHAVGLPTVIRLGRQSGVPLPSWIHIVAVEVDDMESFVEGLTPAVAAAVPRAVAVIRSLLAPQAVPATVPA